MKLLQGNSDKGTRTRVRKIHPQIHLWTTSHVTRLLLPSKQSLACGLGSLLKPGMVSRSLLGQPTSYSSVTAPDGLVKLRRLLSTHCVTTLWGGDILHQDKECLQMTKPDSVRRSHFPGTTRLEGGDAGSECCPSPSGDSSSRQGLGGDQHGRQSIPFLSQTHAGTKHTHTHTFKGNEETHE